MTVETLDLANLDDAGLHQVYETHIAPVLRKFEAPRETAQRQFKTRMAIGLQIAAVLAAAVWLFTQEMFAGFFAGGVGALLVYAIASAPLRKVAESAKAASLAAIAAAIGVRYDASGGGAPAFQAFRDVRLLPGYDRSTFEDGFHGARRTCSFDLYEAHLEDERRDKDGDRDWVTVFRGQLVRVQFPKTFAGVTVVRRDAGVFNALAELGAKAQGQKLERVGLADPKFERVFEVYGTDQVEARELVHPVFMERLMELEAQLGGKRLRCAFLEEDLLIAIEGGNRFEFGDVHKPLDTPERAEGLVKDLAAIMRVIDAVLTAEMAPLQARGGA